jgi:hypothetical protein
MGAPPFLVDLDGTWPATWGGAPVGPAVYDYSGGYDPPHRAGLPPELEAQLLAYWRAYAEGLLPDCKGDVPCIWLQPDGTCRHYDLRPAICREFEVGGEDCLRIRREQGVGNGRP